MEHAITSIGLIAACCTTISFVPQALKVIKSKNTEGISLYMYILFVSGVSMWLCYGILINDAPVIIANAITLVFASTILYYKLKYR
ncbi:hypothetical protein BCY91_11515 [Pelobium manganitolerans]|uniref:Glutathione synthetase n=1 Tax=Pelobium manganitolerans TaxID=1842495 RepID=A0A419S2L6_9SPHI|nr:SemiSWEET transporter [Pelobium manganitolerans]RKD12862.1 hypothetical protein BCY91_11515 [Pelobium manganitolerans]